MGLRIISGRLRGRKIATLPGQETRPTADRLRESVFNILGREVQRARILDLYAGSGALGIEALSRGGQSALFIDNHQNAVDMMRKNIRSCTLEAQARILLWDILKNLNCLNAISEPFNLVFMDPPYLKGMIPGTLENLVKTGKLAPAATLIVEHDAREHFPVDPAAFTRRDQRTYGRSSVTILQHAKTSHRKDSAHP